MVGRSLLIGRRTIFSEGLVAAVDRSCFEVGVRYDTIDQLFDCSFELATPNICIAIIDNENAAEYACTIAALRARFPDTCVVAVTANGKATHSLPGSSADAILPFLISPEALVMALDLAVLGQTRPQLAITPDHGSLATPSHGAAPRGTQASTSMALVRNGKVTQQLSLRETEVLSRIVRGESNKHVARNLDVSEATVKVHVRTLLRKLGAKNRMQAALLISGRDHDNGRQDIVRFGDSPVYPK